MNATSTLETVPFDAARVRACATEMRRDIVTMLTEAGSGHPGGSLSAADAVAVLYAGGILHHDPKHPDDPARDRFILSKGHAAPVLYAVLAEEGYFPKEWLGSLRKLGSHLQGHPDMHKCPGVEISAGSLGQGLSVAAGLALGLAQNASREGTDPQQVYVLLGDGELQEGQVWEAAMFAAHHALPNLTALIDHNNLQIDGWVSDVCEVDDIGAKFAAFGWYVVDVEDGNDVEQCYDALRFAASYDEGPCAVILHTVKGKGVSFMENQVGWHGKAPNAEQLQQALADIDAAAVAAEDADTADEDEAARSTEEGC